jgi:hypothetical protein
MEYEERIAAEHHFKVVVQRTHVPKNALVIPRYTALPYFEELCEDLDELSAKPINNYQQHIYVANISYWYYDFVGITPLTWFRLEDVPKDGPFVLKGNTNSKKFQWDTHMFARNKREAADVYVRLCIDGHIGPQHIAIREYVPLRKLADGLNGLPISEEYRFFVLDGKVLASGFYWSSHTEELREQGLEFEPSVVPEEFIQNVISRVGDKCRFWVFDVAHTEDGKWIVVELNDGQQSGLSDIEPELFYKKLAQRLRAWAHKAPDRQSKWEATGE